MLNTNSINQNICYGEFKISGGWDNVNNSNVSVIVKTKDEKTVPATEYNYLEEFPAQGAVPLIIATPISKTWRHERDRVTDLNWFTISDIDLGM